MNWNQEQAAGESAMRRFEDEDEADRVLCDELRRALKIESPGPGLEAIMVAIARWSQVQK